MNYEKVNAIGTGVIAFSTFLGVLSAIIYYSYQIKNFDLAYGIIMSIIYIDINLLFLYLLKRGKIL